MGCKIILLGGDFKQTLPVVPKGRRGDVVRASINKSYIWKFCKVFILTQNMRIEDIPEFREWVLALGDGKLPTTITDDDDDKSWIQIPDDLLIPKENDLIANIVSTIYPDLANKIEDPDYLTSRKILTPTNETADEINSFAINYARRNKDLS